MLDNSPDNPTIVWPKTVWQSQKNEETRMTLELLRQRVRDLNARRRRQLFATVFAAVIVLALSVWGIPRTHSIALQAVFVLASGWAIAGLYFIKRGSLHSELLDDSTLAPASNFTGCRFSRIWPSSTAFCRGPLALCSWLSSPSCSCLPDWRRPRTSR